MALAKIKKVVLQKRYQWGLHLEGSLQKLLKVILTELLIAGFKVSLRDSV
jgi:hypothetical protein